MPATPAWPPRSAPRLFVPGPLSPGAAVTVEGNPAHYLAKVMRVAEGDAVVMTPDDLHEVGVSDAPADQVLRLARLAQACQLDGVVCSAQEAAMLRAELGTDFRLVTPGIRPPGADVGDQRRVMTPLEALRAGATDLVMGRPITAASDPLAALKQIQSDIHKP
jgi:orotidine 5'-phosphate decarboxylase subfamily 1